MVKEEYKRVQRDCKSKLDKKNVEIENIDRENEELVEMMKTLVKITNVEGYQGQVLEEKSVLLEEYFKKMQDYLNIGDRIFTTIK